MLLKKHIEFDKETANTFNLLTALLCRPSVDLNMNNIFFQKLEKSIKVVCPACITEFEKMKESSIKFTELKLLVEYTRLFIGPFKILAQPYSCFYFGGKTLLSDETLWVINYYEKMGLKFDDSIKDAPDHVAVETEFIYYLIFNKINKLENGNSTEAAFYYEGLNDFYSNHYKIWVPQFCQNIINNTNNDFYRHFAEFFKSFIESYTIPTFREADLLNQTN